MLLTSALVALGATLAAAVQPLEVKGNQFYNPKTGNAFQVVGMAYQPGGAAAYNPEKKKDPLSDDKICLRDAALLQRLGVNAIRVYNLDPALNHDKCASIFNAAGIYMLIDVNSPLGGESISDAAPAKSYYTSYLERTFRVVECFKNYPNTLGFFSGNEVISSVDAGGPVPPIIRAVTRDLKTYVKNHASRPIPVGYSAADVRDVLADSWNYMQCSLTGKDDDLSRVDMFALNSYSWCGDSSYTTSGYDQLVAMFKSSSVPVFFSEFGCNDPKPRKFTEIEAIYSDPMDKTFSGGVVYEYDQQANDYGLAKINNDDNSVKLLDDYHVLQSEYVKVDFAKVQSRKVSNTTPKIPICNPGLIKSEDFAHNFGKIPPPPPGASKVIKDGVNPKPTGKIVAISDYKVTYKVTDANGKEITDLAVKPLTDDTVNTPGTNAGTDSSDGAESTASETPNAAVRPVSAGGLSMAAVIIPAVLTLSMAAGFTLV